MTNQQAPEIYTLHTVPNKGERPWSGIYTVRADAEHDAKVMHDVTGRDWSVVRLVVADTNDRVPEAWTNLLAYVLQDELHNRLTPRVIDIAYAAFMKAKQSSDEDGSAFDWFNDTRPMVQELIAKLRKDLIEELAGAPQPAPVTNHADIAARLRIACRGVRTKSYSLSDLIPLMQQAADALHSVSQLATAVISKNKAESNMAQQPAAQGDALSDAMRVPLDSLHADAAYLIGRLREGSMPYARVIEIIRERIDAAFPTPQADSQPTATGRIAELEDEMNPIIKRIKDGLPKGTTHIKIGTPYWHLGRYEVGIKAFKYKDKKLMVFQYDSDGEHGQWCVAKDAFFGGDPNVLPLKKPSLGHCALKGTKGLIADYTELEAADE